MTLHTVEVPDELTEVFEQCLRRVRHTRPTVLAVNRHLTVLRDGMQQLALYDAELTGAAIQAVQVAVRLRDHQARQLGSMSEHTPDSRAAVQRIETQLKGVRPWQGIETLSDDLAHVRSRYEQVRRETLAWQERQAQDRRDQVKARDGFAGLSGEQSHSVLRPIHEACNDTSPSAVAPSLAQLVDPFTVRLLRAHEEANRRLDELLSRDPKERIKRVDLGLRNRELTSRADVEALVSEVRTRLLAQVDDGFRVRLA